MTVQPLPDLAHGQTSDELTSDTNYQVDGQSWDLQSHDLGIHGIRAMAAAKKPPRISPRTLNIGKESVGSRTKGRREKLLTTPKKPRGKTTGRRDLPLPEAA